ncbi:MAG TPA: pyridoxamine 5'-phosphate oxidase family protein [Polyangiaceae bacterium]|jgi:general stress protein 26|nr:pyridoxamine 5'-phosphate oxidase family protein [Polyangiaceae bacterium]
MAHAPSPTPPESEALTRFRELLSKFHTAMFVTQGRAPGLHARPMAVAKMEENGTLWFVTGRDTPKMNELSAHPEALVCLQKDDQFVTVSGRVEVVQDRNKVEELWSERFRAWFSGKDDPNLVLLRLVANAGEYWDQSGTRGLEYAFRAAKAYAGKQRMDPRADEPDTHASVKL